MKLKLCSPLGCIECIIIKTIIVLVVKVHHISLTLMWICRGWLGERFVRNSFHLPISH
uniref:Uncharacterized protein n=1 Tax=Rhizophora mucronata TaxID=61149 RepID=A0A2P2IXZ2_RHIMU